ncbi:MAG TPA: 3-phosphoshikimate 1-carboxyvinyltransferase [Clostridiaceae bacterium]|nr:3-phosphoshikimate 1-carboxyvinyltransferase [Clostridiaceae bacterium]
MIVRIRPGKLKGTVVPPSSKSQTHRALIAASLADGKSVLGNILLSEDIRATADAMAQLGATVEVSGGEARVSGGQIPQTGKVHLDCGESGSTLRFLIPVALVIHGDAEFTGRGKLMERPLDEYFRIFEEKGIAHTLQDGRLHVKGTLPAGDYVLRGDVSSQFITGLLFALPLAKGDSVIRLSTPLESKGYIAMTLDVLSRFGIGIRMADPMTFEIRGNQTYRPCSMVLEGDHSQAAFYAASNALGSEVAIEGMDWQSLQGDRAMTEVVERLGKNGDVEVDVSDIPDLVPAIAVVAALREGQETRLVNAARLRIKESDRLEAVTLELTKLGARIEAFPDSLTITGVSHFTGGVTDSHNDHRIAMALAIAATRAQGEVIISGAESVQKSYPHFFNDYETLGGQYDEIYDIR